MKDSKILLRIIRSTCNKYTKYTKKKPNKRFQCITETKFSLLILGTNDNFSKNRDQNVILPKLDDQTVIIRNTQPY